MTKIQMIENVVSRLELAGVDVRHIYGVPMGVGYDYTVWVKLLGVNHTIDLMCHAGPRAWAMPGFKYEDHYRFNIYKGTDPNPERYILRISNHWNKRYGGLYEYLGRFTKDQLKKWMEVNLEA